MTTLCLSAAVFCHGQGIITTYAGSDPTYPGSSFSALSASFGLLSGVAVSPSGDVYFASSTRCLILKFNPVLNSVSIVAGISIGGYSGDGGPAANAALNSIQQIAFDPAGNLYIADFQNDAIRKIDTQGIITTYATVPGGPWSVAVAADGTLYVSTYSQIFHITSDGVLTLIGGTGPSSYGGDNGPAIDATFNHIQGLLFDPSGNLLVVDTGNDLIRRIDTKGIVTTIAGNGQYGASVNGPATSTPIANPLGLALDTQGNLYTGTLYNQLLKISPTGTLSVLNPGASAYFLSAPGPVGQAIFFPQYPAFDNAGNLYFTDQRAGYLWEVATAGTAQAVAAYAPNFDVGDNGPAGLAGLNFPNGIWLAADGSLLVADQYNLRVRRISPTGTITTMVGNGSLGTTTVGPALSVNLNVPTEVASDSSGNIYIAIYGSNIVRYNSASGMVSSFYSGNSFINAMAVDAQGNVLVAIDANQILRISPAGVVTVVAGTGQAGYFGDGGPATSARLYGPQGVATDSAGNIYIGDSYNGLVRKVSNGIITTIGGGGPSEINGVPATQSSLHFPTALACDKAGNVYVTDTYGSMVRVISPSGIISAFAGTGTAAFSGDGGLATSASLNQAGTVAVDGLGNVYISDRLSNRIRKVLATPPSLSVSSAKVSVSGLSNGTPVQTGITVMSSAQGLVYSIGFTTQNGGDWLGANLLQGQAPGVFSIITDPGSLQPGNYQGTVTITSPNATPQSVSISVTFQVSASVSPSLSVGASSVSFALLVGSAPSSSQMTISNLGGGSLAFTASFTTTTGGSWLQVSPTSGTASSTSPASLTVTATPGSLGVGTYAGSITVTSSTTGQTVTVPVTLAINPAPQTILLSQTGLTFTAVAQGGSVIPQSVGILNVGSGSMTWSATATTLTGSGWLSVSPSSGTVNRPFLDVSFIDVTVNAQGLASGQYFGNVQVTAPGASNSPQTVLVVVDVLPPGSNPGPQLRPTGFVFTTVAGAENPGAQTVTVANVTANPIVYGSSPTYVNASGWISYLPANGTVNPDTPEQVTVQPNLTTLAQGVYRAVLTLAFDDGSVRNVGILGVVAPAGATASSREAIAGPNTGKASGSCAASKLLPVLTQLGTGPSVLTGWPVAIVADVVDDCGSPVTSGSVVASFTDGDAPLPLISLGNGDWSGTWQPQNSNPAGVTVTVRAQGSGLMGSIQTLVGFQGSQTLPMASSVVNAVTLSQGPLAPGELVSITGTGLADAQTVATTPQQVLGGASVLVGSGFANLLYAANNQLIGQVPSNVPVNTSQQIVLQRDNSLGVPSPVIFAAAQPAIFTANGASAGQGLIYQSNSSGGAGSLTDGSNPAQAGETVIIYCTGLGVTDSSGNATIAPAVTIGGLSAPVSYAGNAIAANYPSGGAPMLLGVVSSSLGGLYQITAKVPAGLGSGPASVFITSAGQTSQSGVTMMITGQGSAPPSINPGGVVDAASYAAPVAPGSLVAIFTSALSAQAASFSTATLPPSLGGVSVTFNGITAPMVQVVPTGAYPFVSAQVPFEALAAGQTAATVPTVIIVNGVPSAPVPTQIVASSPGIFTIPATGQGNAVLVNLADYSIAAPVGQIPGLTSHPIPRGQTAFFYVTGLGAMTPPVADGSGTCPAASGLCNANAQPTVSVGGVPAQVAFAGQAAGFPGVTQINITVPQTAPTGNTVALTVKSADGTVTSNTATIAVQ